MCYEGVVGVGTVNYSGQWSVSRRDSRMSTDAHAFAGNVSVVSQFQFETRPAS